MTLLYGCLRTLLVGLAGTMAACGDIFGHACTLEVRPGIIVAIRDAQSGAPVADSAAGVAVDVTFTDSLQPAELDTLGRLVSRAGAFERPGTYNVSVTRHGYANWSQSGVRVTRGDCHVNTVRLAALLQPVP